MQHDYQASLCLHHNCQASVRFVALGNTETYLMSGSCMSIKEVQHIHNNCYRHTILKGREEVRYKNVDIQKEEIANSTALAAHEEVDELRKWKRRGEFGRWRGGGGEGG